MYSSRTAGAPDVMHRQLSKKKKRQTNGKQDGNTAVKRLKYIFKVSFTLSDLGVVCNDTRKLFLERRNVYSCLSGIC